LSDAITDENPSEFVQQIRVETLHTLLTATSIGAAASTVLGLLIYTSASSGRVALSCGFVLFVICRVAAALTRRDRYFWAVALFLAGGVATIAMTIPDYGILANPFIFFIPLLVGVAALLLRPAFGFIITSITALVLALVSVRLGYGADLLRPQFLGALLLGFLSSGLMLLAAQSFVAAVDWALDSYRRVQRREQQLFDSERRLQLALGAQDQLNFELTRSNKALERARATAEDANRLKSQFVRNMTHELRTPLNAIIGLSYILRQEIKGPLTGEQRDFTDRIYDSGNHLLRLLNDVLDNAKMEAGKLDLQLEALLLDTLFDDVLTTARVLVREKPIQLRHSIAADLPAVYADRLRVAQVLLNLLGNAAKFTERGTITLRAALTPDQQYVLVAVTDTGIGIAAEHQDLIFEEFRQVDETVSRRSGGTGLGLPISRRLVELLGGRLRVESAIGRGSTFAFTLPIANVNQLTATEPTSASITV
jgi:signal transduction histidine kinase